MSASMTIVAISFVASVVTGALGYGFSSIAVPVALLVTTNRVLNPAVVLLEVAMNAYALIVNREALPRVWRRAALVALGLPPGILLGTSALTTLDPSWLKFATFVGLLPLILLQAAGFRRAFQRERTASAALGAGVGVLYAVTTVSGPPLAMFLTNQGLSKSDFRVSLALIRLAASVLTTTLYLRASLYTADSLALIPLILPCMLLGIPLGARLIRHIREETFRRVCMSFDAAIVSFGVSALLRSLHLVDSAFAYVLFVGVVVLDAVLLVRFFRAATRRDALPAAPLTAS